MSQQVSKKVRQLIFALMLSGPFYGLIKSYFMDDPVPLDAGVVTKLLVVIGPALLVAIGIVLYATHVLKKDEANGVIATPEQEMAGKQSQIVRNILRWVVLIFISMLVWGVGDSLYH